jgi:hypothetical protein
LPIERPSAHAIVASDPNCNSAEQLYEYLLVKHWRESGLVGPDSGIRFNYRIGRFVKSYLSRVRWRDDLYYLQAQGYWIIANWMMADTERGDAARRVAVESTERVLAEQQPDGAWAYPNPEWHGRVTTYEGVWASLGLLETYRHTGDERYLEGALRWHAFADKTIGYQNVDKGGLAANYFAGRVGSAVPNATTDVVRFLAEVADATGSEEILGPCPSLLTFLRDVQRTTGELPYEVTAAGPARLTHYQCFQYNAFECLGLLRYFELTGDPAARQIIEGLLAFLATGVAPDGSVFYACGHPRRHVTYHAAALAAAFTRAAAAGFEGYDVRANRLYTQVRGLQRADGSFPHSRGDYRILSDRRAYPRNLAMILVHLLASCE